MPNRWNQKKRLDLLEVVALRYMAICGQGLICLLCHKIRFRPRELSLDHLDNNKRNNRPENLNILCRGCNVAEENRRRAGNARLLTAETLPNYLARLPLRPAADSQISVCVDEREKAKGKALEEGDVREAPNSPSRLELVPKSSLEVSQVKEPRYRWWGFQQVKADGGISTDDAIRGGAYVIGISPLTAERYFGGITSRFGWLEWGRTAEGNAAWVFRKGIDLEALELELKGQAQGL